ncbi:MAG: hypothetical protein AB7H80_13530 [Candidatus Kapaibacterium sp.]
MKIFVVTAILVFAMLNSSPARTAYPGGAGTSCLDASGGANLCTCIAAFSIPLGFGTLFGGKCERSGLEK